MNIYTTETHKQTIGSHLYKIYIYMLADFPGRMAITLLSHGHMTITWPSPGHMKI